ncbi:MAG TPA: GAF domain-containing protein, partial [Micromonosporaceae bacterium]|nr:GAF domain-containing protein [Micromonosporaceae bacterium]
MADRPTERPGRRPASGDLERQRILRASGLDAAPDEAFDGLARLVKRALGVPVALVSLVSADRQFFPGAIGLAEPWSGLRMTPLRHALLQYVVETGNPLVLSDARQAPWLRDSPAIADLDIVAYAGMPLTDLEGHVLGVLCAIDVVPRQWTQAQLETLADLAAACSSELRLRIALERAREARRRADVAYDQLTLLTGLTETLAGTLDMRTALDRVADTIVPQLADWCLITLVDPSGGISDLSSAHRDPSRADDVARFSALTRTRLGDRSITRAVLRTG